MSLLDKLKQASESGGGASNFLRLSKKSEFGMRARIRFLQELDEGSPNFDPKYGLGYGVDLHKHPTNYRVEAPCTFESEGQCLGCELAAGPGVNDWQWKVRTSLLINVGVRTLDEPTVPKVLRLNMGKKALGVTLLEYADEFKSITDRDYKFSRTGDGKNDTTYSLIPVDQGPLDFDGDLFDLAAVIPVVPYDQQKTYYLSGGDPFAGESQESLTGWEN